jgi:UDP-N-acetyl-alpha-D-muramoyl-L-alanyl-L-glutamate epimerase
VSATASTFDRATYSSFRFLGYDYDVETATVTLSYGLDERLRFDEVITLPPGAPPPTGERATALHAVLGLLHLVAGVSYFKAAAPPQIELAPAGAALSPRMTALLQDLYTLGLGEFAYRNQLDPQRLATFPASRGADGAISNLPTLPAGGGSLVPIGGGKDSVVALEIARAVGPVTLFSIGERTPIARTAAAAGLPHLVAQRRVSPLLLELNARGALNGHVPVTAIVSLIALATAVLHGHERVVMANERSASQGNLHWRGIEVNHQWSKGASFERELRELLATEIVAGVDYFSVLRPAGELAIARAFASLPVYHDAFTSCNSVFRLSDAGNSWCRDCPKCRFVFLALAPFLEPEQLLSIFGADLLDDPAQTQGFFALCGFQDDKPFECVGEREESVAALRLLADADAWRDHHVVAHARATLLAAIPPELGRPDQVLELRGAHNIPQPFLDSALAHLRP